MEPISIITAVAGALGVGTVIGNLVTSYRQRRDRREEREAARDEAHRADLRRAYSEFIAAYAHFVDEGTMMYSIYKATQATFAEAMSEAVRRGADEREAERVAYTSIASLNERASANVTSFVAAATDANAKAAALLIIEEDAFRRGQVDGLAHPEIVAPQSDEDHIRFKIDLDTRRRTLKSLRDSLGGTFSPDQWHREVAARRVVARIDRDREREQFRKQLATDAKQLASGQRQLADKKPNGDS